MDKNTISHIAIIMDGNRRWAKKKGLSVLLGHEYVVDNIVEKLIDRCIDHKVKFVTLWAFSTENWNRDKLEVQGLMKIFRHAFERSAQDLHKKGVKLNIIGGIDKFPSDIAKTAKEWVDLSKDNTKITVNFALNYGGRDEILRGVKKIAQLIKSGDINEESITQELFQSLLDTKNMPDPDLIIRPGGQYRLSGFLPWQSVYSELYFTDVLMPDFGPEELDKAIEEYYSRQRRFGK